MYAQTPPVIYPQYAAKERTLKDFLGRLSASITVSQLETPLDRAFAVSPSDPESSTRRRMGRRDFDYAPVIDGHLVIGRVARSDLKTNSKAPLASKVTPLGSGIIASGHSPIGELIAWLRSEPFLFVLEGRTVTGLVTVSDLNRQAARTYLYAVVAGTEMLLAELLRREFKDQESALQHLTANRQATVRKAYLDAGDEAADLVSAMYLSDVITVIRHARIHESLGYSSKAQWDRATNGLSTFRAQIAHPVRPIVRRNSDIERVHTRLARMDDLTNRVPADIREAQDGRLYSRK